MRLKPRFCGIFPVLVGVCRGARENVASGLGRKRVPVTVSRGGRGSPWGGRIPLRESSAGRSFPGRNSTMDRRFGSPVPVDGTPCLERSGRRREILAGERTPLAVGAKKDPRATWPVVCSDGGVDVSGSCVPRWRIGLPDDAPGLVLGVASLQATIRRRADRRPGSRPRGSVYPCSRGNAIRPVVESRISPNDARKDRLCPRVFEMDHGARQHPRRR